MTPVEQFKETINQVKCKFPNTTVFATNLRQVMHANRHLWGAVMLNGNVWESIDPKQIAVMDRIGGGDAFVGGLLYGILKGYTPEKQLQFGWACGALACTFVTDYLQPDNEEQIWDVWNGNMRVKR